MMQDDALLKLLERHIGWYPLMELRDFYKLLYQGVMGSEHLQTSAEEYTQNLYSEFEQLKPDPFLRLLESVRPDRALYRLNLGSYKAQNSNIDRVTPFLVESARIVTGTRDELKAVWENFVELCLHGQICNFDAIVISQFSQRLETVNYPAMHHSEIYRIAYKPAYRLLAAKYASGLVLTDSS